MTTTSRFQMNPDFYFKKKDAMDERKETTNPRYPNFRQNIFHAGDEEQFEQYRDATNGNICKPDIPLTNNIFAAHTCYVWHKHRKIQADAVINTFRYIFHKFKKGIFVKIVDNKLTVFLPFSKANFTNEWGKQIQVKHTINSFLEHISNMEGRRYNPYYVSQNTDEWYANNCLVRYESPLGEGDSNVGNVKNMLEELCASSREVPDIEFFINRRDFPILTRDGTEPYNHIWGRSDLPLVSHSYDKYVPILSMSNSERYADVLIPTWEDWARIQSREGKYFPRTEQDYLDKFDIPWSSKKPTAVFRGSTTGCGVTIETNPRLHLAYISVNTPPDERGVPYLDASITKWNLRPRKLEGEKYLQTIDKNALKKLGIDIYKRDKDGKFIMNRETTYYRRDRDGRYIRDVYGNYILDKYGKYVFDKDEKKLLDRLSPKEQSGYKYIINVEGHVSAFRLSLELSMGSVILMVNSKWKIWYSDMLIPYTHYVPVKADLSNLIEQIKWCRENDDKCEQIAKNAKKFFLTFLQKDGVLDYMQKVLIDLKSEMGVYLYNSMTPLDLLINKEYEELDYSFPKTEKSIYNLKSIPFRIGCDQYGMMGRTYGLLQGMEWVTKKIITERNFEDIAIRGRQIFENKLGSVRHFIVANFSMAVKSTFDRQKIREHIHEAFICSNGINQLSKYIPNFVYVFGLYRLGYTYNVVTEYITTDESDQTLLSYISSKKFSFQEFLFILLQICLGLQVAQNMCGFVHYDLTPWNIVLQRLEEPKIFDYILSDKRVIRVRTSCIPVIIDFGKSHIIHSGVHHGFVNMFKVSTVQDIMTLLLKSVSQILSIHSKKRMESNDFKNLLHLLNFISGTKYRPEKFEDAYSAENFLWNAKKYSSLISDNKYDLENFTPYDLFEYIVNMKDYKFSFEEVNEYISNMDKGNAKQVFDYVFSVTTQERIESYVNIFKSLKHCTLPQPKNLFFIYYVAQSLERNLMSVRDNMIQFLDNEMIDKTIYETIFSNTMMFLYRLYKEKINTMKQEDIEYSLLGDFKTLIKAPYSEETFLDPEKIIYMIQPLNSWQDLSDYKEIIQMILLYKDTYKLRDTDTESYLKQGAYELQENHRQEYLKNFEFLLETNSLNMMNNTANIKTLLFISNNIYKENIKNLLSENCMESNKYLELYKKLSA